MYVADNPIYPLERSMLDTAIDLLHAANQGVKVYAQLFIRCAMVRVTICQIVPQHTRQWASLRAKTSQSVHRTYLYLTQSAVHHG